MRFTVIYALWWRTGIHKCRFSASGSFWTYNRRESGGMIAVYPKPPREGRATEIDD